MLRILVALTFLSSPALACIDFSGKYDCQSAMLKVKQAKCEWIAFREWNNQGQVYSEYKTDGLNHQTPPHSTSVPVIYTATHTDTDFTLIRTWTSSHGAQTRKNVMTVNEDGSLKIVMTATNEANPPATYEFTCVKK